jgi:ankyrin repeat protein
VVDSLLAADGIDVNKATTHNGMTALMVASAKGHQSVVDSLLAVDGIDVGKVNDVGANAIAAVCLPAYFCFLLYFISAAIRSAVFVLMSGVGRWTY